ncbi:unnamed protein product [Fraxinus pennsylvanica]|uniref:Uncharacterized protein n=1 Tax=Fraxinus pennsylvanica TaxID=56036 RepID=A0AAD1YKY5_9LAMI|nr:unnamed protein product [Fraxinus pennsylvanica]
MAEINGFLLQQNHILQYTVLDSKSLLLSQFSDSNQPQFLQLTTESPVMERGPRYKEYSDLREKRLRKGGVMEPNIPRKEEPVLTPPKKQVKFQGKSNFTTPPRTKGSSILTQSVPDFSSALRKENRKPASMLPPVAEKSLTPPPWPKSGRLYGKLGGGSKSVNSGEKRSGGIMTRKSHASMEELKGLGAAANNIIDEGNRGGRIGRTLFGHRQF